MPSGPSATAATSGLSGSIVITTSAPATAPATLSAPRPPASTNRSTAARLRLTPITSCPAAMRLRAIGAPMMPSPTNATVVMR